MYCIKTSKELHKPWSYTLNQSKITEEHLIAEGGYGYVWSAKCNNIQYALKRIICSNRELYDMASKELTIHQGLLPHPNIVDTVECGEVNIQNKINMCIMTELCQCNLYQELEKHSLTERQILDYFKQIVDGVEALHAQSITHRDLKLENILLSNNICKICDFGSASTQSIDLAELNKKELHQQEEVFSKTSTQMYRPPEMTDVLTRQMVDHRVDIWQLGCILYSLCYRTHPFNDANRISIAQAQFNIPQSDISINTVSLIQRMLQADPKQRPTIKQLKLAMYNHEEDEFGEYQ